jgi:hypothetical protein
MPPDAHVTVTACKEDQDACKTKVYAAIEDGDKTRVPKGTFTLAVSIATVALLAVFGLVGVALRETSALQVKDAVIEGRMAVAESVADRIEKALLAQAEEFRELRQQLVKQHGVNGSPGGQK